MLEIGIRITLIVNLYRRLFVLIVRRIKLIPHKSEETAIELRSFISRNQDLKISAISYNSSEL